MPKPPEDVELDEDAKANVTDPDSSLMKPHDVWIQGYNGQAMIDCDTQAIVAEDVIPCSERQTATRADARSL